MSDRSTFDPDAYFCKNVFGDYTFSLHKNINASERKELLDWLLSSRWVLRCVERSAAGAGASIVDVEGTVLESDMQAMVLRSEFRYVPYAASKISQYGFMIDGYIFECQPFEVNLTPGCVFNASCSTNIIQIFSMDQMVL